MAAALSKPQTASLLQRLNRWLEGPSFHPGERVNKLVQGSLVAHDGHVIAHTQKGVLVEWPRFGLQWEYPQQLCAQG